MAYIYLHRRNDTGEVFYVGKGTGKRATSTQDRNSYWHNVVNKAGFTAEIIARGLTDEEAYWVEPLLIEAHGGVENLTNMSDGGEGFSSEEAKALWQDPAHREKISKSRQEMWQDPEYREKRSMAMKDPTVREKMSKANKRRWQDPAMREKMSKANKRKWQDPEYREKRSKAAKEQMLEQWQDPAFREKRSKATKELWQDPAFREKQSKAAKEQSKRRWQDPEYREKMSKAGKEQWKDPAVREKLKRKVECDKCGKMVGICGLTTHQRGSRCYNSVT